ncbi:MAG: DEAD/DEAH box helicase, partial [Muribaculaceae bacterium]|nr:DEAD/DEAH box helicase [Muribaculaceae bacterium]
MREKEFLPAVKDRLGIEQLNEMQIKMMAQASEQRDIILLSPTGSGKTLAFTLPVMKLMKPSTGRVQCVVIAPSRELVMQIAGVMREVGRDFRVVALYGGHNVEDEVNSLKVVPDIIVATPGRLLDHAVRRNIDLLPVRILVLDEFDKSLELGFEEEMEKISKRMKNVSRFILTSATNADILPEFLNLTNPVTLNFVGENKALKERMRVHRVDSDGKDKLESLLALLHNINTATSPEKSIIFVNHRESAERVADFLKKNGVDAVLYHGALDQRERETAVALFNNGSRPVLVATDLAARGLDIEKVASVIHYHQPLTPEAYTHRNGRTARVEEEGDVY